MARATVINASRALLSGSPLKAEDITYGGWRCTPWYILDTSNPEVQEHLTSVVRTMREEWGVDPHPAQ